MTVQSTARTAAGSQHHTAGAPLAIGATAAGTAAADRPMAGTTRTAAGVRGRALLAALGLALAAAVLPAAAVHASPQSPGVDNQFANPGGNPQPPEPPDPPQWGGPDDLANPTEDPDPPLPPEPPVDGPDDLANPTEDPDPPVPPTPDPDSTDGDSIPTPQRVDAGFGGAAVGAHQFAGLALIAAALALTLLVIVIARRHRAEARSAR
jgi:outer membrane biosynthesis protein TonB